MKVPKQTKIQSLLFCPAAFTTALAKKWAREHGFKSADVDTEGNYIRLRQHDPKLFQEGRFRTIELKKGIKAVIGWPWIPIVGNPHPKPDNDARVLFDTIHRDWSLHRRKHTIYATLAKAKGTGKYETEKARRRFKPLVVAAAKLFRRQRKVNAKLAEVFPASTIKTSVDKLMHEFLTYWNKGQLDQYLPRKGWSKRKEK